MSEHRTIHCGVVGVGWWGKQMCERIASSGKFHITSVFDPDAKRTKEAAEQFHCTTSNNFEDLITNDEIECIFIFSPNSFHPQQTASAAKFKKHIFLEKPIANTVFEAREIVQACEENRVILAIGHNVRHYGIFQTAKHIIDAGSIGDIIYIDGNRSRPIGYGIDESSWRFYRQQCNGGPIMQMAIHLLDTVRFIVGLEVQKIKVFSTKKLLKTENDETFDITLFLRKNVLLHLFSSYVLPESFYLNFFGTNGNLFVDPFNGLFLQKKDAFQKEPIPYQKNNPEEKELSLFYDSIIHNRPFREPTVEEAVDNVAIIENILASL